jgi:hypothetical protein
MPERLILCGRARRTGRDSILRLDLSGRLQNITLRLADISRKLLQNVSGPLIDLIEMHGWLRRTPLLRRCASRGPTSSSHG